MPIFSRNGVGINRHSPGFKGRSVFFAGADREDGSTPTAKRIRKLPGEDAIAEAEIRPATFIIYKFRTYRIDADHVVQGRANFEFGDADIGSIHLQLQHDPRVTRVGRFLRRTSLDELPNLINVLRGEMSLVGPRPEVIQMFRHYTTEQRDKFTVKPGITGLAQVNGRGKLNFEQTLRFDLDYVRHRSVWLDLRILFKTIRVVLTGDGSF